MVSKYGTSEVVDQTKEQQTQTFLAPSVVMGLQNVPLTYYEDEHIIRMHACIKPRREEACCETGRKLNKE